MPDITIYNGHVLDVLKQLPDNHVHMCITSPPYWGLRSYQTTPQVWDGNQDDNQDCNHEWTSTKTLHNWLRKGKSTEQTLNNQASMDATGYRYSDTCTKCGAWHGELGTEPSVAMYIKHLVIVFAEVYRVLRDDGVLWINISSSYIPKSQIEIMELRDDLTNEEIVYVLSELAKCNNL